MSGDKTELQNGFAFGVGMAVGILVVFAVEKLSDDLDVLDEHHDTLGDELREEVCDDAREEK